MTAEQSSPSPDSDPGDVGVVEGAAGGMDAEAIREIRERAERVLAVEQSGQFMASSGLAIWASTILALVADREALLERIRELEQLLGGSAAACSGGDS